MKSPKWISALASIIICCCLPAFGKTYLTINSTPPGAKVEIDGVVVGVTPFSVEVPGGYLHGTKSVFGKLLRQQMHVRLTLDGYLPVDADLARGPMQWFALNGTYHGDFWLLKTDTFSFTLQQAATTFTGKPQVAAGTIISTSASSQIADVIGLAAPAVLFLKTSTGHGSGFVLTDSGLAVTNAHVATGEQQITAVTANGQSFVADVAYIDPKLDLALLQLKGSGFAHLMLANPSTIAVGQSVFAIGTPSQGFQNSVTKGIVSALGPMPNEPGMWIQTDAAINPGNSGGPLLNETGQVVGITTLRPFVSSDGRPLQGIGFALSGNDLLTTLRRFYPSLTPGPSRSPEQAQTVATLDLSKGGRVSISADVEGADIYVDGKFVGNAPSVLTLSAGTHNVEVRAPNRTAWQRQLEVLDKSDVNLKAALPSSKQ